MKPQNVLAPRLSARRVAWLLIALCAVVFPSLSYAAAGPLNLTLSLAGITCVGIFVLAYALVMSEELLHMRKSKPVLVAAGLIWAIVAWVYVQAGMPEEAEIAFRETLLEYTELLLFLLVAMTYINAMEERRIFDALRAWLVRKGFSYRSLFGLPVFSHLVFLR